MDVLIPVDGSANSERAVRFVIALCEEVGTVGVRLLHVYAEPPMAGASAAGEARSAADAAAEALRAAASLLEQAGIAFTSEARPAGGYLPGVIADTARERSCAAIVMGTRGLGLSGDPLGSIARQVVAQAEVPVTLVK